jgi:pyruvate/2-oxoglutarate dehydrogenase complex dihydrolipoamide dehydrogenase (E3) component
MAPQIMIREDKDAALAVQRQFEREGIALKLGVSIAGVAGRGAEVVVRLSHKDGREEELVGDRLLVAAGRAPNVEGIGLEQAGVEFDARKGVQVDDTLRTSNPKIYAAGDVCSRYQFTHTADFLARIVIQNALFPGPKKRASDLVVPWCTYTDPEVAHVGMYEKDARDQGIDVATLTQPFDDVDRAILDGEDEGFVRMHIERSTGKILGATIVASHAGEMIGEMSVAVTNKLTIGQVGSSIHPYPTQAEAMRKLGDAWNRTRLKPSVKNLLRRYFKWTR